MDTNASVDDILCVGCGYDLRNLPVDGPCPECGRAIAESVDGRRLTAADPTWLKRLATGQALIAAGVPVAFVALCLIPLLMMVVFGVMAVGITWTNAVQDAIDSTVTLLFATVLIGILLCVIGAILVTAPDPSERDAEHALSGRNLARWGLALTVVFAVLFDVVASSPLPVPVMVAVQSVLLLLMVPSVTTGTVGLLRCLAARGARIPDHDLVQRTASSELMLRWTLPICLAGLWGSQIVSQVQPLIPALAAIDLSVFISLIGGVGGIVGLAILFELGRVTKLMKRYRDTFRAARDEAIAAR